MNTPSGPKPYINPYLAGTLLGIVLFLAFFMEYIHNVKSSEDEERLHSLRTYLKLRPSKHLEPRPNGSSKQDTTNN